MRITVAIISLLALTHPTCAERDIYDKCETTLRLCFQRCLDDGVSKPKACNSRCTTSRCEGIGGTEKPLTDFLRWKDTNAKVWL